MSIGRTFKESLQKAIRSLEMDSYGLHETATTLEKLKASLKKPNPDRLRDLTQALRKGMTVEEIHELTSIDPWFLTVQRALKGGQGVRLFGQYACRSDE
jgi:carbamoyl-phosphate synthase large subunit